MRASFSGSVDTEEHLLPTTKSPGSAGCTQTATCMSLGRVHSPSPRALVSPCCLTLSLPLPPDCTPGLAGFGGSAGRMGVGGVWPPYLHWAPSARLCPERNKAVCMHPGWPEASNTDCPAPSRAPPMPGAHLKCRQWDPPGQWDPPDQQAWAGCRDVFEQLLPFWPQEPGRHSGFLAWCTQTSLVGGDDLGLRLPVFGKEG